MALFLCLYCYFEHISHLILVIPLLTLSRQMPIGLHREETNVNLYATMKIEHFANNFEKAKNTPLNVTLSFCLNPCLWWSCKFLSSDFILKYYDSTPTPLESFFNNIFPQSNSILDEIQIIGDHIFSSSFTGISPVLRISRIFKILQSNPTKFLS